VPTKTVLKVGFLERDFERDHLAEKSNRTKMGQKIHCGMEAKGVKRTLPPSGCYWVICIGILAPPS
jgi:hypothetical protein